ncbi:MAG: NADH-quinone oxidoreductase subunit M, partial [Bacteroidota bacterium]
MNESFLLSLLLLVPVAGAGVVALLPSGSRRLIQGTGLLASVGVLALAVRLFVSFDGQNAAMQFVERYEWIPSLGSAYYLGVDGISLLLVVLTALLTPVALLASWESIARRLRAYVALMLLLEAGTLGVFLSLDTLLFYVFWEFVLIPMYFIIGIWGGGERIYAAVKFFLYTMAGSLLMLVGIIWLGVHAADPGGGTLTTDLLRLFDIGPGLPPDAQRWLFLAFALSFCIKVPLFPLHTWLPDAHVQAPTAGSVILAGVLLKMGTYGILRFCFPLFPLAAFEFLPVLSVLAVAGIIYGALVSMVQT